MTNTTRLLVCGSRTWEDVALIESVLLELWDAGYRLLAHGAARGADRIAGDVGDRIGYSVTPYKADWDLYGKSAGAIRNRAMFKAFNPGLVVAFRMPGKSSGTDDMVRVARSHECEVLIKTPEQW